MTDYPKYSESEANEDLANAIEKACVKPNHKMLGVVLFVVSSPKKEYDPTLEMFSWPAGMRPRNVLFDAVEDYIRKINEGTLP